MVSIYLDQKENELFSKALGAFRQASMAIWLQLPEKELSVNRDSYDAQTNNLDWRLIVDTYETVLKLIGKVESKIAKRNGRCKCRQLTMQ